MISDYDTSHYFMLDLVVAVANSLPDVSTSDIIIPIGLPTAQFAYANYSALGNATLGAVLAINLPYTVNTTSAIETYLEVSTNDTAGSIANGSQLQACQCSWLITCCLWLISLWHCHLPRNALLCPPSSPGCSCTHLLCVLQNLFSDTAAVMPSVFFEKYSISAASGIMTALTGNTDAPGPPPDMSTAIGVGVGVGIGLPALLLLSAAIYKFLRDANTAYVKVAS